MTIPDEATAPPEQCLPPIHEPIVRRRTRSVRVGDPIEVENGRFLVHEANAHPRRVGSLKKGISAGPASRLRVAAVCRYPQVQDTSHPEYWEWLTEQVQMRGWSYVVLVTGYLSAG